ncbi:hypothetical protein [Caenispirillum salinarum]|uniref:hypothetical protein n=1 Tax=Caenispirillum salinarum TaxID=859058 RepID=UPI00385122C3
MAKAAMESLYVDPTTRFVNSLITSEIEVSDSLLDRIWPRFSADLLIQDECEMMADAADFDGDEFEIEFEADEDEDGFLANLLQWSPRRKKG